jgi:diguanylate cyclase (GGDEF)-like protein
MTSEADPNRVRLLEEQIRELQQVHTQLVNYAEDLNRTYLELRLRLQQMTVLSSVATQLVRARSLESAARTSLEGLGTLFSDAVGRVYVEDKRGTLKLVAERTAGDMAPFSEALDDAAHASTAAQQTIIRVAQEVGGKVVSVGLEARGRAFGSLVVLRPTEEFSEHDLHVVELLGHGLAVAIENARLYQETRRLAITDPTTGISNFRHFRMMLGQEIQKARRLRYPIALLMVDIDHFKSFNDLHGHPKGNVALRRVAQAIVRSLRQTDTVARYGGEEFAVILPGCDRESLGPVAEKIRESVARSPIRIAPGAPPAHVTISIGAAWQDSGDADAVGLLSIADNALYQAKALGRNRAYVAT